MIAYVGMEEWKYTVFHRNCGTGVLRCCEACQSPLLSFVYLLPSPSPLPSTLVMGDGRCGSRALIPSSVRSETQRRRASIVGSSPSSPTPSFQMYVCVCAYVCVRCTTYSIDTQID